MIACVSTWSAHRQLLEGSMTSCDFLTLIAQEGAKGVEIVDIDFAKPDLATIGEVQSEAAALGLMVTCLSVEHSLCRLTASRRQADIDRVKRWMNIADTLGVRNVRVFTGWMESEASYSKQLVWVYDGLHQLANYAEQLDLDLVLENHNNVCLNADEIIGMLVRVQSPRLFTCPDVFNYKTFSEDLKPIVGDSSFAEIEPLLPFARNAHLKICQAVHNDTEDLYLDIPRMLRMLAKYNYDGPVALEYMWPYLNEGQDAIEGLRHAIRVLCHQIEKYQGGNKT